MTPRTEARATRRARRGPALVALGAGLVTLAGVALLFLRAYPARGLRYPFGWDATFYVWRADAVTVDGLARIPLVRGASPLLFAVLKRATGQNAFTIEALSLPVLAGVCALGAAAMARAALGIGPLWVPVIGALLWVGLGPIGLLTGYGDQTMNAALVLSGFACALAFVADRVRGGAPADRPDGAMRRASGGVRGAVAVGVLFAAAGFAEWPFYVFAMGVFSLGLALFWWFDLRGSGIGEWGGARSAIGPLAVATVASGLFTLLLLVGIPGLGAHAPESRKSLGANLGRRFTPGRAMTNLLRQRFLHSVRTLPVIGGVILGAVAAPVVARARVSAERRPAQRLLLWLAVAWTLATGSAAVLQLAGAPVAGARLLLYFFVPSLLIGLLLWAAARAIHGRIGGHLGRVAAAGLVLAAVVLGLLEAKHRDSRVSWVEPAAVRQLAAAGAYLSRYAPDRDVVVSLSGAHGNEKRWRQVIMASLPPEEVPRVVGSPQGSPFEVLARFAPSTTASDPAAGMEPIVLLVQAYSRPWFQRAHQAFPEHLVATGVLAPNGPVPSTVVPEPPPPRADTTIPTLLWLVPALALILFGAGGGWSVALLPPDPVLRTAVAPALGIAATLLVALGWERLGLGFHGWQAIGPLLVAAVGGWALAARRVGLDRGT